MISRRISFRIFGRNQAPQTDRLNQVPYWEFRNRRKSFTPRQLARILWDFAYLCWANTALGNRTPREAIKTPEGLESVKYLLHTYEQSEARQSKDQRRMPVSYDFLWSELKIDQRRESWATAME